VKIKIVVQLRGERIQGRKGEQMGKRVCPWWLGSLLASRVRRWIQGDPEQLLLPYLREGMTVLEPGPGMGFFTLPLARMVGPNGRVIAVEVQPRMLDGMRKRLAKAGLSERVDGCLAKSDAMGVADLAGTVDFTLAFAVVHELPSAERFFVEVAQASKPGASVLFVEPSGHVKASEFESELEAASQAHFAVSEGPRIQRSRTAVLRKT
jgi:predicted O-methyltransferase YrrM